VLAAFGADVLRLDPPGFEEVAAIVPDTTGGKRCARLDLRTRAGLARFDELVARADVLVCGLRPGALTRLGRPPGELLARNPSLVLAELSAYGDTGPWAGRRGVDSLVQTACGIADEGMRRAGADRPVPLPVQALDHASGWLLAAGVLEAVRRVRCGGGPQRVEVVLARTARWLQELPRVPPDDLPTGGGRTEQVVSPLGTVTRVRCPGEFDGRPLAWGGPPSALGAHEARFADG
jgi:crotonobetainyl-CoA:carnitine CoA-transferase CaiB-like acyl-CoA transferase